MATRRTKIAWLIPCYNEEITIGQVIDDIKRHCPAGQIHVFDNNSTDKTAKVAREHGATVHFAPMRGKGNVVYNMFYKVDADLFIMVDGDSTYDVSNWRKLANPIMSGEADMTVGTRLQNNEDASFRRFHRFGNFAITGIVNLLFRANVEDMLSGYRAFSRDLVKSVPIQASGFEIETELTLRAIEGRYVIKEVPLEYGGRPEGSTSKLKTFEDGALILLTILSILRDQKPLTFFGALGAAGIAIGGSVSYFGNFAYLSQAFLVSGVVSIFTGFILNAISLRAKELTQVMRKSRHSLEYRQSDNFNNQLDAAS